MSEGNPTGLTWTGRVLSGIIILLLLFDAVIKVLRLEMAVQGTTNLGYPESVVIEIGAALLVSTLLYAIPRTSVLGAILLTAYLGGATASQVRVQDSWFLLPVAFGVLVWLGLFLRDSRVRALIPISRSQQATKSRPAEGSSHVPGAQ